jgi:hypothetical protein
MPEISNTEDILDSRFIQDRIDALEAEIEDGTPDPDCCAACGEPIEGDENAVIFGDAGHIFHSELCGTTPAIELLVDEIEELASLEELKSQCLGYGSDWRHGMTLVRDSYFPVYAERYFEDTIDSRIDISHWPYCHIDWAEAAEALQMDFTSIDYDGVTYWVS